VSSAQLCLQAALTDRITDTDGILEEGEVFFKSSHRLFRNPDGTEIDIYTGDILLTRYPCKLPTDTQKVI
jgi:RNA-dependent RNA polymerase